MLLPCLHNMEPILLVGPEGCGKSLLLRYCFSLLKSTTVATLHCGSQTTSSHVIIKLNQHCVLQSSTSGRVYRPKDSDRLILYLKDINLPTPDKYDTIQLIAFLQQIITYNSFYDEKGEKLSLERICIVCSITPSVGRFSLSTRFTAITKIFYISYPDKAQLQQICSTYLKSVTPSLTDSLLNQQENIPRLATSMVTVFEEVTQRFTTDLQPHYIFTPRDLVQWILGLEHYSVRENFFHIWKYEACRVFRDRLVAESHQRAFDMVLNKVLKSDWQMEVDIRGEFFTTWSEQPSHSTLLDRTPRKQVLSRIAKELSLFEREMRDLNIVLFMEILDHMARLDRVLSLPGGSILLVGKSGVGRGSAVSLVAFINRYRLITPSISPQYGLKHFHSDIKQVLQIAGIEGEKVVFLLEDHQLGDKSFLPCVNSLLSSGEIPGLYNIEEIEPLCAPLKEKCADAGFFGSLYQFFIERVKANLHIALVMDDSNKDFLPNCQSNPSLFTKCVIQWWEQWGHDVVSHLPIEMLKDVLPVNDATNTSTLFDQLLQIHKSMETQGVTPRKFVTFISTFKIIYNAKCQQAKKEKSSLSAGLTKLGEASATVSTLSKDAAVKREQLQLSKSQASSMMIQIKEKMQVMAKQQEEMTALNGVLVEEQTRTSQQKESVQGKLSEIQPLLDGARNLVKGLTRRNIEEMRTLRTPSQTICDIMEGVVRLTGDTNTTWPAIKAVLGRSQIINELVNFDPEQVTVEQRRAVEKLLLERQYSFEPVNARHACQAALPLAQWVTAVVKYSEVKHAIAPLERDFAAASAQLAATEEKLSVLKATMNQLVTDIETLKTQYQKTTEDAMRNQIALEGTEKTLAKAKALLNKLGVEQNRWTGRQREIEKLLSMTAVGSLLAAAFVTYLGSANEDMRAATTSKWKEICGQKEWSFVTFLSNETELAAMRKDGLPSDSLSAENALIINWTPVVPFIIDPSSTSENWLMNFASSKSEYHPEAGDEQAVKTRVEVVTQGDPKLVNKLELAVRFGKTLVIQEADKIHPVLFPLLRKSFSKQGPQVTIQIGDRQVTYSDDFRMFLLTRDPQPDLTPDARALICEVNYTVTRSGLEGQLLGIALTSEKPSLEQKSIQALIDEDRAKLEMLAIEEKLLTDLGNASGNILENVALQDSLNETKQKASEIALTLSKSATLKTQLDSERNLYKPIATTGSKLFFMLSELHKINSMYCYSLTSFLPIFKRALGIPNDQAENVKLRINSIIECLQKSLFEYIARSIFKGDRLTFSMHMVHIMKPELFQQKEWEVFVGQTAETSLSSPNFPSWITAGSKDQITFFAELETVFPSVLAAFSLTQNTLWANWSIHVECEMSFPSQIVAKTTPFQRLLLIKALRPDRLESAMANFCTAALSLPSLSPAALNLERLHANGETSAKEPILLITTLGADPSQDLEEVAGKHSPTKKFTSIPMGQGQQDRALATLVSSMKTGDWVILKNLHLAVSWLPVLEQELKCGDVHPDFRLWLTTEPHDKFSTILLQSCMKITFEAPPGIKKNLERTYGSWSPEFIRQGSILRAQCLFTLAWFHAIIQERRKYIPQAWTKFYEFNEADLRAATDVIDRLAQNQDQFMQETKNWASVHGLLENAVYGGRVDNTFDFKVLQNYLRMYFCTDYLSSSGPLKPLAPNVNIPQSANHADYLRVISALPVVGDPVTFSLPHNIDRSQQRTNSSHVLRQLKSMASASGVTMLFSTWKDRLNPIVKLWRTLTKDCRDFLNPLSVPSDSSASPIDAFVIMQASSARALLQHVDNDVSNINEYIMGRIPLSAEIHALGTSLLLDHVPESWESKWDGGPTEAVLWVRVLVQKTSAIQGWMKNCLAGTLLSWPLNLNDLFHPSTFVDALCQQTARSMRRTLDTLTLVATWTKVPSISTPSATISGMLLQGCTIDSSGRLVDAEATAPELVPTPALTLYWLPAETPSPYAGTMTVDVPVYLNLQREKLVMTLSLPCTGTKEKWCIAGVALFLSEV
ncbi:cytoplasmic dynein 2 heavy chain 1 [Pelomyxa schiedti]|nr:cytoplasmic dynein 2 heavy chain 1 [Pelomyxa schiedti]